MTSEETYAERFWPKVDILEIAGACWNWTASHNIHGYGKFQHHGSVIGAHRFAYEYVRGEIPVGLHLDHLCRNRSCVNPWHLEPVTMAENNRRSSCYAVASSCKKGHPFSEMNTYTPVLTSSGRRIERRACRVCKRISARARKLLRKSTDVSQ